MSLSGKYALNLINKKPSERFMCRSSVCGYSFQSQGDKWGPDSRHITNDGLFVHGTQANSTMMLGFV
jgi:hypothetical protein